MKKVLTAAAILMFAAGLAFALYPVAKQSRQQYQNEKQIEDFRERANGAQAAEYDQLQREMNDYNVRIYEEHQVGLKDAWSYTQNEFDFSPRGIADDMVGSIRIEKMGVELPLYIGAGKENLRKGAAVLFQTSMPVGGDNTNCVIAAHRGGWGQAMFREIELLKPGDEVQITNFWGTLTYRVMQCLVIRPQDIEAVKIQEGKDLVTLITCHPYRHNYQRYVVYCSRVQEDGSVEAPVIEEEGETIVSSQEEIHKEDVFQKTGAAAGIVVAFLLVLVLFISMFRRGKRNKRR